MERNTRFWTKTLILFLNLGVIFIPQFTEAQVKIGLENLLENHLDLIKGKKIGIIANQTSLDSKGKHIVEVLLPHTNITTLFGPEHGFFGDNEVVNNLFFMNKDCRGYPEEIFVTNTDAVRMKNNVIAEAHSPPLFLSPAEFDLRLKVGSPVIDQGVFLTKIISDGSGTELKVKDAKFFSDGFGISGLKGDMIQLEGDNRTARVVKIDYQNNMLIVDRDLTWHSGQGVSLEYEGQSLDVGAFEHGNDW